VNEAFGTTLPDDDFDTIGGLVAHQLGHVPRRGEAVEAGGLHFQVMLTRGGAVRWFRVDAARRPPARRTPVEPPRGRAGPGWPTWLPWPLPVRCRRWPSCTPPPGRCRWPHRAAGRGGAAGHAPPAALAGLGLRHRLAVAAPGGCSSACTATGLPAPLAAAAVVAAGGALSLYLAAAMAWVRAPPQRPAAGDASRCSLRAGWLAELARGVIFTGFPWVASGYAQVDAPAGRAGALAGGVRHRRAVGGLARCWRWPPRRRRAPGCGPLRWRWRCWCCRRPGAWRSARSTSPGPARP
jgi:hypothetical protein